MAIKFNGSKAENASKDDALFVALGQSKKKKKRRIIITVLLVIFIVLVGLAVAVNILQRKVRNQFANNTSEVLSYTASEGTISTVVSGSGTLTDVDLEYITVPSGVEVTEILVNTNESIEEGDVIATVNMASVMSAMADLQTEIGSLDEQLSEAEDDEASEKITAGVTGRVKIVYAQEGDNVANVMYENGALAVLSLDGYMAVDIETTNFSAGDSVTVRLSDGEEISGVIESVTGGIATVLVTDNGPEFDEEVVVLDENGSQIGSGNLYIHNPLRITGYAGTIDDVCVSLNASVSASTNIFTLEDTAYSANYYSLLRTRSEKEEELLSLLTIERNGAVVAPYGGSVYSVDYDEELAATSIITLSNDEKMSVTIGVDESDILSLELGQEVTVTVSSISEETFAGTLTEINRTTTSSGTYSAVVEIEKAEGMLSGMTASVSVQIEGVSGAILIPVEAIHKTSDGAYVYTTYNAELNEYGGRVDVITGLENSTYVEIKSGLSVGDVVYYTEAQTLFAGFGGGDMSGFDASNMPNMDDGSMPDFPGGNGGNMPNMGGGGMPNMGGGGFPGGN